MYGVVLTGIRLDHHIGALDLPLYCIIINPDTRVKLLANTRSVCAPYAKDYANASRGSVADNACQFLKTQSQTY